MNRLSVLITAVLVLAAWLLCAEWAYRATRNAFLRNRWDWTPFTRTAARWLAAFGPLSLLVCADWVMEDLRTWQVRWSSGLGYSYFRRRVERMRRVE